MKKLYLGEYSIDETIEYSRELASIISEFEPEILITILEGGRLPGLIVSEELGIENIEIKIGRDINVKKYYNNLPHIVAKIIHGYKFLKSQPKILSDIDKILRNIEGKKVIVIDDAYHTGKTSKIVNEILTQYNISDYKIGTINFINKDKTPDYTLKQGRIRYPWSKNSKYYDEYINKYKY